MRYFSTRDKKLDFSFTEIFSRGLAPDGGLFIPSDLKKYTNKIYYGEGLEWWTLPSTQEWTWKNAVQSGW